MIAQAPKTHFQLAYSAIKPETMFPQTLPRGAPAADYNHEEVSPMYPRI